jgi:4a-hydroxytetrahydrobiopterin dehydratase
VDHSAADEREPQEEENAMNHDASHTCDLAGEECIPCLGGMPPLAGAKLEAYCARLGDQWDLVDGIKLMRSFTFKDFSQALNFTCVVGELAEAANHHPDIELSWGRVGITLWTHKISGLSQADFVLAARINALSDPEG